MTQHPSRFIFGGVGAYILADTVTELVWKYSYEQIAG